MDSFKLGAILLLVLMFSGIKTGTAQENELRVISSCLCPGCELVVECTVTGDGAATIWQGTIFKGCLNEMIALRHSGFISGIMIQESCGAREPVVVRSVSVANGSFTSQLLVNTTDDLLGTIECANESGQIIGSKQIDIPSVSALLSSINIINVSALWSPMVGELTITWDIEYNETLNSSDILNMTQLYYYTINISNYGMCPTTTFNLTSSTSATCNVTSDLLAGTCNVTVVVNVVECGITTEVQHSIHLMNDLLDTSTTYTPDSIAEQIPKRKDWSTVAIAASLPMASTGVLLLVLTIIFITAIMKYKSKHKTRTVLNPRTEGPSDHSNDPIGSDINNNIINLDLGEYSLLQHPSDEDGMVTYLEIGSDARVETNNIISSADRVEYAEVNHAQPQNSVKNEVDKYLNLDTLLIQVRCQVTPLWHEFGVAAGVPVDTLNKCLNSTPEESVVEVLDYWLRQGGKTWRNVAHVLNNIHLQELAEKILKIYDTGLLPTAIIVDKDIITTIPTIISVTLSNNSEVISDSEKSQSPPPPLPPKP